MTRFTQAAAAAGLVCLGAVAGSSVWPAAQAQPPRAVPVVPKWEYKLVYADSKESDLNALGAEGWELVVMERTTKFHQVYKRPRLR